jgi:hypothetical protein
VWQGRVCGLPDARCEHFGEVLGDADAVSAGGGGFHNGPMDELTRRRLLRTAARAGSSTTQARRRGHPCVHVPIVRTDHRGRLQLTASPNQAFLVHQQPDGSLLLVPTRPGHSGSDHAREVSA